MKLLSRTTLYFLLAMIPVLAAGGWYLANAFDRELRDEIDEELINDRLNWLKKFENAGANDPVFYITTPEFSVEHISGGQPTASVFADTIIYSESQKEAAPYRKLTQVFQFHGNLYRLYLSKSVVERNDYVKNITTLMAGVFAALLLFVLLFNLTISRRIWRPFYQSLDKLKEMEIGKLEELYFPVTPVEEFNRLNDSLNAMKAGIAKDFTVMKEFTEDAAHEMQTPLAIAGSKLEILLQDPNITEEQSVLIAASLEALQRLKRLGSALLLLAKIDKGKYEEPENISLGNRAQQAALQLREFLSEKKINIQFAVTENFTVLMPASLADILIGNLLGNAIKYNKRGGIITVETTAETFSISNTGEPVAIPAENLFRRFKKGNQRADSNGLGLAIVHKIAERYKLSIFYRYETGLHHLTLKK